MTQKKQVLKSVEFCEHGNECLCSIKLGVFDYKRNYQLQYSGVSGPYTV